MDLNPNGCELCSGEMDDRDCELVMTAAEIRERAHCPYSGFAVGAALRTVDGRVFSGVNVENASYGLTVCAERNAIAAAVAGGMRPGELQTIVITSKAGKTASPCGACRQVIAEFAAENCLVISGTLEEETFHTWHINDLLPAAFEL